MTPSHCKELVQKETTVKSQTNRATPKAEEFKSGTDGNKRQSKNADPVVNNAVPTNEQAESDEDYSESQNMAFP